MKVVGFVQIDGKNIFIDAHEANADPEATIAEIADKEKIPVNEVVGHPEFKEMFEKYKEYFRPSPGRINMSDAEADNLIQASKSLDEHHLLLLNGDVIANYAGAEYWKKDNNVWEKHKIIEIGQEPDGPLSGELTEDQLEEINKQEEKTRIDIMSPEERMDALQIELDALSDEADRLERRARRQGKEFDPDGWYQEHEQAVKDKYFRAAAAEENEEAEQ